MELKDDINMSKEIIINVEKLRLNKRAIQAVTIKMQFTISGSRPIYIAFLNQN